MFKEIASDADKRMEKSVRTMAQGLASLRTGRASVALVEGIRVDGYDSNQMPLNQLSSITVEDSMTLAINVWGAQMVHAVKKAIMESGIGLTPMVNGTTIRLKIPPLTEDRRRDLVKLAGQFGEASRVAIRNIRREANQGLRDALKNKELTKDDVKKGEESINILARKHINSVDELLAKKEEEIMRV